MKEFIKHELVCLRASEPKGSDRYEELTRAIEWLDGKKAEKPNKREMTKEDWEEFKKYQLMWLTLQHLTN